MTQDSNDTAPRLTWVELDEGELATALGVLEAHAFANGTSRLDHRYLDSSEDLACASQKLAVMVLEERLLLAYAEHDAAEEAASRLTDPGERAQALSSFMRERAGMRFVSKFNHQKHDFDNVKLVALALTYPPHPRTYGWWQRLAGKLNRRSRVPR